MRIPLTQPACPVLHPEGTSQSDGDGISLYHTADEAKSDDHGYGEEGGELLTLQPSVDIVGGTAYDLAVTYLSILLG